MKQHYLKKIHELDRTIASLRALAATPDLAALHRLVVDLKTSLPERLAYENSPLLLDGLRVTRVEDVAAYTGHLAARLETIREEYKQLAAG